jgi:hypothetical protein
VKISTQESQLKVEPTFICTNWEQTWSFFKWRCSRTYWKKELWNYHKILSVIFICFICNWEQYAAWHNYHIDIEKVQMTYLVVVIKLLTPFTLLYSFINIFGSHGIHKREMLDEVTRLNKKYIGNQLICYVFNQFRT